MAGSIDEQKSCHKRNKEFDSLFIAYAKFGDSKGEGKMMTLSNSDKWMKAGGVIPTSIQKGARGPNAPLTFTCTETGIEFKKISKSTRSIGKGLYLHFIEALIRKKLTAQKETANSPMKDEAPDTFEQRVFEAMEVIERQLTEAGPPTASSSSIPPSTSLHNVASSGDKMPAVIQRLTDHTKYTGSHKLRFDPQTGKGRGKEGRV